MTVLEEEQFKLRKMLKKKPTSESEMSKIEKEYEDDLSRLKEILKNQKLQKEIFENDIRNLRLKSRPLPPICPKGKNLKIVKLNDPDDSKIKSKNNYNVDDDDEGNNRNKLQTISDTKNKNPSLIIVIICFYKQK